MPGTATSMAWILLKKGASSRSNAKVILRAAVAQSRQRIPGCRSIDLRVPLADVAAAHRGKFDLAAHDADKFVHGLDTK